jgi:hypothetical protein
MAISMMRITCGAQSDLCAGAAIRLVYRPWRADAMMDYRQRMTTALRRWDFDVQSRQARMLRVTADRVFRPPGSARA